jgi:antitoxin component of RelBE/YafQ-DinJ toxin-antitoxin module
MPQANVRIDSALIDQVRKVSEKTGVPISRCISDAVSTWLQVTAPQWLEARKLPTDRRYRQRRGSVKSQQSKLSRSLPTSKD